MNIKNEIRKFPYKDFLKIADSLSDIGVIFNTLWELGTPIFTNTLSTAAVSWQDGNVIFYFNPDFWDKLSYNDKLFIFCHETLHVIWNHQKRFFNLIKQQNIEYNKTNKKYYDNVANVAMDLSINENLIERFSFDKSDLTEVILAGCWLENMLPSYFGKEIQNWETYFMEIIKNKSDLAEQQNVSVQLPLGLTTKSGGQGTGAQNQDTGGQGFDELPLDGVYGDGTIEKIQDILKDKLKDKLEVGSLTLEELEEELNNSEEKTSKNGGIFAGTDFSNSIYEIIKTKRKKTNKKKWEKIIKKYTILKEEIEEHEDWIFDNRRFAFIENKSFFLPSIRDVLCEKFDKAEIYLFWDISGSCIGMRNKFYELINSIPEDKFQVTLFTFDTRVQQLKNKNDVKGVRGGGGTNFNIIEQAIQKTIKDKKKKYPSYVWILSDGHGTYVTPEKPERWYWFMTEYYSKHYVHSTSKVFKMSDFE